MRLSFVWWNTSLSPLGKNRATDEQRRVVCSIIDFILNTMQTDFIALGEISKIDENEILKACNLDGFRMERGFAKVGRSSFGICFIYKSQNLALIDTSQIISKKGNRTLKIAIRADFNVEHSEKPLHIFISHWPSLLRCHENSADRHLLGVRLRDAVESLNLESGKLANVILLGDYNNEPFNDSLAKQLMATRDRELVRKKPHLLYNPFWRHLAFSEPYSPSNTDEVGGGTYFHKKGEFTRWLTFDQILFSSAFLGHSDWHINEVSTGILRISWYAEKVMDTNEIFDHFPVLGVIERVKSHG